MATGVQPDHSSRDKILKNADGSVDLYFGPKAPIGKPVTNWIKLYRAKGGLHISGFMAPHRHILIEAGFSQTS